MLPSGKREEEVIGGERESAPLCKKERVNPDTRNGIMLLCFKF